MQKDIFVLSMCLSSQTERNIFQRGEFISGHLEAKGAQLSRVANYPEVRWFPSFHQAALFPPCPVASPASLPNTLIPVHPHVGLQSDLSLYE